MIRVDLREEELEAVIAHHTVRVSAFGSIDIERVKRMAELSVVLDEWQAAYRAANPKSASGPECPDQLRQ